MPLRHPPPLTNEQYDWLVSYLKKEEINPNPERIARIKLAVENAKKIKTHL